MRIGLGIGIPQFQGNGSSGIAASINFAQLVTGDVPSGWTFTRSTSGTYFDASGVLQLASTNVLRISRDPVSGELGYLAEPGRTNLALYSEQFNNAAWVLASGVKAFGSGSVVNATSSPDGSTTMDFICEDTSTGNHEIRQAISVTSGTTYCTSVFAKYGGRYLQIVYSSAQFGASQYATFDLQNGVVSGSAVGTASIDAVGGGVYRCSFAAPATATAGSNVYITISNAATGRGPAYTGDGSSGVYIWGAQLEAGSYPTSYIPTTTVAVSRGPDLLTTTLSAAHAAALSVAGTMVARFSFLGGDSTADIGLRACAGIDNGAGSDWHYIYNYTSGIVTGFSGTGGSTVARISEGSSVATNTPTKFAYTFRGDPTPGSASFQAAKAGVLGTEDTTGAAGTMSRLVIGGAASGSLVLGGLIHDFQLHTSRLTDAQLQALTA